MKSLAAFLLTATAALGQIVDPTLEDVAYSDDHEAQKLDVYQAKSDQPVPAMIWIHGGGWRAGSKDQIPAWLALAVRGGWLSVVSVEYRFTDVATHPAQVEDCLRAVQFVRHHAAEWNIDPSRLGVAGGSAGAHLSLCVALRDDVAQAGAEDPVERESSRVLCAVSFAGPTDWSLLDGAKDPHPGYRQIIGHRPDVPAAELDAALKTDVSPISFVTDDDPPLLLVHGDADTIVPLRHAEVLDAKADETGIESELFVIEGGGHGVMGDPGGTRRASAFVREHLATSGR